MLLRKTKYDEIEKVMKIVRDAQEYFKNQGIDQWQNNYPNEEVIKKDIDNNISYVLVDQNRIIGTIVIDFEIERTYEKIYEGEWLSEGEYAVIHRVAIADDYKGRGIAGLMINEVEKIVRENGVNAVKGDTHRDNQSMQRLFIKNGFKKCGIIYLPDGSERIAFQKLL